MDYIQSVITREFEILRNTRSGRNNQLFRTAVRLYELAKGGAIACDDITNQLTDIAKYIGLPLHEIRSTLRSAFRRAQAVNIPLRRPTGVTVTHLSAPDSTDLPCEQWQCAAEAFVSYTQDWLWAEDDERGLAYLNQRHITDLTALNARLGWNRARLVRPGNRWGRDGQLVLPAGIVIPYYVDRRIAKIEIRSITHKRQYTVPGSSNVIWNISGSVNRPVMLVEGVLNALIIQQYAGDLVTPMGLGGASNGRRIRWIARLARAPLVLVSTDNDAEGERAAQFWLSVLPNSRRWRPYVDDANTMSLSRIDVRAWVCTGLEEGYQS